MSINEVVMTGKLDTLGSLKVFCEAVDNMAAELTRHKIMISFICNSGSMNAAASNDYTEDRARAWKSKDLQWQRRLLKDYDSIIEYMTEPHTRRLAVFPTLFDGDGALAEELLMANVPIIASTIKAQTCKDIQAIIIKNGITDYFNSTAGELWRLPEAINSIEVQTYMDIQAIIIDDSITDYFNSCLRAATRPGSATLLAAPILQHPLRERQSKGRHLPQRLQSRRT
ncbi:hypothetical protein BDK51DRAFT_48614 [Blyttiomyces helicus]|uniref:Uncharacterized protein n=1 Tax=Blyttiomyces helicus TaxID=388810 RepID=A0A4P9WC68_9FUNG|nr:hypothetical protein BDK51DRAFT_48614 [Blyttiomyces helicus]|eukprot:RKO89183.1 hypothetical protein BDK51DRAFT_48614 [Blyttiomyces helicus]